MNFFINGIGQIDEYKQLVKSLKAGVSCDVTGVSAVHKGHIAAGLASDFPDKNILIVAESESAAMKMCDDINTMYGSAVCAFYPAKDLQLISDATASEEYNIKRLGAVASLITGKIRALTASAEACLQLTVSRDEFEKRALNILSDDELDMERLAESLVKNGYTRAAKVEAPGQFAIRGSIADIFAVGEDYPVRIETWGDEIDSMSYFDTETQRRTQPASELSIFPAKEVLLESSEPLKKLCSKIRGKNAEEVKKNLERDIARIDGGLSLSNADKYISLAYETPSSLFDYFEGEICLISEFEAIKENALNVTKQHSEDLKVLLESGEYTKSMGRMLIDFPEMTLRIDKMDRAYLDLFTRAAAEKKFDELINFTAIQNSSWSGELKYLKEELKPLLSQAFAVLVMAGTEKSGRTLAEDLRNDGIPADYTDNPKKLFASKVQITSGTIGAGIEYPSAKIAVITSLKTSRRLKEKHKKPKNSAAIGSLSEINPGDLVVHVSHGIGKYEGVEKLTVQGVVKDYIKIKYAGTDVLYVPVTQLDLVSRYIGAKDDSSVKLNKLNSTEWQKARTKARGAVKIMAEELIKLYAQRLSVKGFAFSEDTVWQKEFEEHFDYAETDDQLRCIAEIKSDMEKPVPMDRLLCGDVGFGKTEVALRGAFKCVMDSKQVAILVPTTVLALQHYQTIVKRIGDFPVNVELLSRFRTPKQQKEILRKLKDGTVDVIIGTHRLLQKDIEFKSLGLLIIDEEQRFGVQHKEKLKEKFVGVDTLSLSATPIPRTLNMAMSGIRDMSVISEPPENRYPVQTYVIEYDREIIAQAITKELRRDGQVYYIHNRIDSIHQCAAKLAQMVPEARIGVAHGRMGEDELVEVWRQLMEHEIDVLVCTTLIETGVDVGNCNTLIIEDAQNMGLSQLYQLRGRVGRNNRRAYAYFTFTKGKALSEVASKRLEAIREFTQFGSGFRIAMRDLEIRGAGSILGERQHGHMEAVGYDMYIRLLSEEIARQKGEELPSAPEECLVDIGIDAHIPEKYISEPAQRIEIYRRLAGVRTQADAMDIIDELVDRFGEPPKAVTGLIKVALLRNSAAQLGITEINQRSGNLLFFTKEPAMEMTSILAGAYKGRVMLSATAKPYISVSVGKDDPLELMEEILNKLFSSNCGNLRNDDV